MKSLTTCLTVLIVTAAGAVAQEDRPDGPDPADVEFLVGVWEGQGTGVWGEFVQTLTVTRSLAGRGLEFAFENRSEGERFVGKGIVSLDRAGAWRGSFHDQSGVVTEYRGRVEPGRRLVLESVWFAGRHTVGRRTWTVQDDGSVRFVLEGGPLGEVARLDEVVLRPFVEPRKVERLGG